MVDYYSFGTRQALAAHFANNSDPAIVLSSHLGSRYIPTLQVRHPSRPALRAVQAGITALAQPLILQLRLLPIRRTRCTA
jgi:hypothetical protein